jgi:hypothetical protein
LLVKTDTKDIFRVCYGAELGAGTEISFLFGFSSATTPDGLLCGAVFCDADALIITANGVAVGCGKSAPGSKSPFWLESTHILSILASQGFNGNFMMEFTVGGGAGLGVAGTSLCLGFELQLTNSTIAA